jgi:PAS domain S-box-containing protein
MAKEFISAAQPKTLDPVLMKNIIDRIPGMVALYNIQTGEYIYVNKSVKKLLGYTPDEFINGGFPFAASLIHPDDVAIVTAQNQKALALANSKKPASSVNTSPIVTFEYRMKHADNSWRWLHTDGVVFDRDEKGKVRCVMNISIDITKRREDELREANSRKQFEQKLLQNERRYRSLIEHSYEVVIVADKNGLFTYASPSIKNVLGYTAKEIIGKNTLDLFPPETRDEEIKKFGDVALVPGKTVKVQSKYLHKNGKTLIVESTVSNLLHDPFVNGFVSNFRDITKEKKAAELQYHLAAIIASSDDAIISKTLEGIITSWNKAAHTIFGYTAKEAIGKHISMIIPLEQRSEEEKIIATLKRGEHVDHFETVRTTKSGKKIFVSLSISPIKDDEGHIIGASKIARDITQRKKYEEILSSSQERLQLAVDAGKIGIWDWDIVNNKIIWSERVYEIHGVRKGSTIGELEKYQQHNHPDDAEQINLAIKQALKGEKPYQEEFRILTPNGKIRWVETRAHVIRDADGKPIRMLGATTDISERKHLEQQKDEFIGIASHELKTPVTSIKAYTQLLENKFRKAGDEKTALFLMKVNAQLDKLTILIGDLLDITKIETGKLEFHEDFFDFNELVNEIVDQIQPTAEKHKLITNLAPSKSIYGDRDRIGQVLTNFLTNAVKYSPMADKVVISSTVNANAITISVEDFGIGIEADLIDKVFERFFRVTTSSGQTFPGMGLGLYISSQIIKRQQGKIWVESKPGKGSTFSFSIPLNRKKTKV